MKNFGKYLNEQEGPSKEDIEKAIKKLKEKDKLSDGEKKDLEELEKALKDIRNIENEPDEEETDETTEDGDVEETDNGEEDSDETVAGEEETESEDGLQDVEVTDEESVIQTEQEDLEDFSLLEYKEKIKMIIDMLKEFGYSGLDYKIEEDGSNTIIMDGKPDAEVNKGLKDLAKDLDIKINVANEQVAEDKFITKIVTKNNMDFKKFKDIMKLNKKKDREKEAAMMGMDPMAIEGGGEEIPVE